MPNWCNGNATVVLPTKNVDAFIDLFLVEDDKINEQKTKYFYRTWVTYSVDSVENDEKSGLSLVRIPFYCAWSVYSCLIEKHDSKDAGDNYICPTLEEVVKDLDIKKLVIFAEEPGLSFEENVNYDASEENASLEYDSRDMYSMPDDVLFEDVLLNLGYEQ